MIYAIRQNHVIFQATTVVTSRGCLWYNSQYGNWQKEEDTGRAADGGSRRTGQARRHIPLPHREIRRFGSLRHTAREDQGRVLAGAAARGDRRRDGRVHSVHTGDGEHRAAPRGRRRLVINILVNFIKIL